MNQTQNFGLRIGRKLTSYNSNAFTRYGHIIVFIDLCIFLPTFAPLAPGDPGRPESPGLP